MFGKIQLNLSKSNQGMFCKTVLKVPIICGLGIRSFDIAEYELYGLTVF